MNNLVSDYNVHHKTNNGSKNIRLVISSEILRRNQLVQPSNSKLYYIKEDILEGLKP